MLTRSFDLNARLIGIPVFIGGAAAGSLVFGEGLGSVHWLLAAVAGVVAGYCVLEATDVAVRRGVIVAIAAAAVLLGSAGPDPSTEVRLTVILALCVAPMVIRVLVKRRGRGQPQRSPHASAAE